MSSVYSTKSIIFNCRRSLRPFFLAPIRFTNLCFIQEPSFPLRYFLVAGWEDARTADWLTEKREIKQSKAREWDWWKTPCELISVADNLNPKLAITRLKISSVPANMIFLTEVRLCFAIKSLHSRWKYCFKPSVLTPQSTSDLHIFLTRDTWFSNYGEGTQ